MYKEDNLSTTIFFFFAQITKTSTHYNYKYFTFLDLKKKKTLPPRIHQDFQLTPLGAPL